LVLRRCSESLVFAIQTPASAEAACLQQPALQHQQHGGDIKLATSTSPAFKCSNASALSTAESQHHQHLCFSSAAVQPQHQQHDAATSVISETSASATSATSAFKLHQQASKRLFLQLFKQQ
jgi:hypothetical protein